MSLLTRMLRQKCVYWELDGYGPDGQPTFKPPIEIKCRWEDAHENFVDPQGNDIVSNSIVYTAIDIKPQSMLWLGNLADLTSQTVPSDNEGAYAVRKFEKIPDLKAKKFLRIAVL